MSIRIYAAGALTRVLPPLLLLAGLLLGFSLDSQAQQAITGATLTGRVADASGARIPGAEVTVTHVTTNQSSKLSSDAQGSFRFGYLPAGDYVMQTAAAGFATTEHIITLSAGQTFDCPVTLAPAATAESVIVIAKAPAIETTRTQTAALVAVEEIRDLPLNGRNYLDLALLVPGVSRTNTGANQRFAETSAVPGTGISISSQRNLSNSFLLDGLSANDDAAELAGTFFGQEVIGEFQVVSSGGIAEYGRASSGVINMASKAGGNTVHGSVYGFLRNHRLDASNFLTGTTLPLTQVQYGASIGGPIIRDRTFYFANFEQSRQNTQGVITIDAASVAAINERLTDTGYSGTPVRSGTFPTSLRTRNFFVRADHRLTPKDNLTLRYSWYDVESENARNIGGLNAVSRGAGLANSDHTVALSNVWTPSGGFMNETRMQFTRSRLDAPVNDATGPAVNILGVANFGTATFSPTARDIDLFELANSVTLQRGRHSFKFGGNFLHNDVEIVFPGALQGVYTFSSLASFLAGDYLNFQQAFGVESTRQGNPNLGIFVQDEWRARPNLTINAGLRYDVQRLEGGIRTDGDNIAPRVGIAWDPWSDSKTVIRASYGVFYDSMPLRALANALQRDGVQYKVALVRPTTPGAPSFPDVLPAFPAGMLTNITTMDDNIQNGFSRQFALQADRELTKAFTASIGYTHLRGRQLIMARNINVPMTTDPSVPNLGRPDPTHANDQQFQSIGESWYDGMTLAVQHRPAGWGSVRLSYTWSKALDTAGNFFFSSPQDNFDIAAERGRSDNDQRHRLTLNGTLNAPGGASRLAQFYRDWQMSYIYSYTSALPFNILAGADLNGDTNPNDRPAGVARNAGQGFDFQSLDLRLSRRVAVTERVTLQPMIEAFNVFNHRNNLLPNATFGTGVYPTEPRPGFGEPTAVADARQLQLGLRLEF